MLPVTYVAGFVCYTSSGFEENQQAAKYRKVLLISLFDHTDNATNVMSQLTLLPVPISIISNFSQSFRLCGGYFRHLKSPLLNATQGVLLLRLSFFVFYF